MLRSVRAGWDSEGTEEETKDGPVWWEVRANQHNGL